MKHDFSECYVGQYLIIREQPRYSKYIHYGIITDIKKTKHSGTQIIYSIKTLGEPGEVRLGCSCYDNDTILNTDHLTFEFYDTEVQMKLMF